VLTEAALLRLMTYNVHRCLGTDGILSLNRIAEVIAAQVPDVVALQELDVSHARSGGVDQPTHLARLLGMQHHFSATIRHGLACYGIALLTRGTIGLYREAPLPTAARRRPLERRAAMWATIEISGAKIHVINTHLGLDRRERELQVAALMGSEWLDARPDELPLILCGDFNFSPLSRLYARLTGRLKDAQTAVRSWRPRRTYPSRFPLLRIDHVFVSNELRVQAVDVPRDPMTRRASDHRPLVVSLEEVRP
jgi:endonuclease/exonuclease/phosphatase family metal-dependent hydrolase